MKEHMTNLQNSQGFQEILETMEDGVYFTDLHRVITRWNKAAERISGYSAEAVIGSSCRDNILVHVDEAGNSLCLGMCPLAFTMKDGQPRETKVYLHHKEGHRVPVMIRALPQRDGEGKIIGGIELFTDMSVRENLEFQIEQLQRLAMLDPLTSLPNRRYLQSRMEGMHQEFLKSGIPWGVLFFDIDRFKRVNDTYGHEIGDRVLTMVSKTLSLAAGPFDTIARWGGEEFAGIFPNVTLESLEKTAERLRMLVEHSWTEEEELHINVTISIGGTVATPEETPEQTVHRADKLMYRSKEEGRNRSTLGQRLLKRASKDTLAFWTKNLEPLLFHLSQKALLSQANYLLKNNIFSEGLWIFLLDKHTFKDVCLSHLSGRCHSESENKSLQGFPQKNF